MAGAVRASFQRRSVRHEIWLGPRCPGHGVELGGALGSAEGVVGGGEAAVTAKWSLGT